MSLNTARSKMDADDLNDISKADLLIEQAYRRDERLGILGVHQGQEPTPAQLKIVYDQGVAFGVEIGKGKICSKI